MNEAACKRLYDAIECASHCDGIITVQDILDFCGIDLDKDGSVTDTPLYFKKVKEISKYTGRPITVYRYSGFASSVAQGYEPYMIADPDTGEEVHATERMLTEVTNDEWIKHFDTELADDKITYEEFRSKGCSTS